MKAEQLMHLAKELRRQKALLLKAATDVEADLADIVAEREIELEELAQDERAAFVYDHLDAQVRKEVEAIDAALLRIAEGTYGQCVECGKAIPYARLKALPATPYCVTCASEAEQRAVLSEQEEEEAPRHGEVPPVIVELDTDVAGVREVVDRLEINELLWEREDRERPAPPPVLEPRPEPPQTEDLLEAEEEGKEYLPPGEPPPDKE